jgi:hypothetical protein
MVEQASDDSALRNGTKPLRKGTASLLFFLPLVARGVRDVTLLGKSSPPSALSCDGDVPGACCPTTGLPEKRWTTHFGLEERLVYRRTSRQRGESRYALRWDVRLNRVPEASRANG